MHGYNERIVYSNVEIVKVRDNIVSCGQTLFHIKGRGLGHIMVIEAVCHPALWSAYQPQHTIQSNDTYLM